MAQILLVEDTSDLRTLLRTVLERAGHQVVEAADGRQAMDLLGAHEFDLIITDILLPEEDGLALIREAKSRSLDARVLAMSGGGAQLPAGFSLKLSEALGADAILYKPFDNDELIEAVQKVLGTGALNNPYAASSSKG